MITFQQLEQGRRYHAIYQGKTDGLDEFRVTELLQDVLLPAGVVERVTMMKGQDVWMTRDGMRVSIRTS